MSLLVIIKNASNLPNKDSVGKSDPYVTICFQGEKKKTEVKNGTLDPTWNEEFTWNVGTKPPRPDESIDIIVKDHETIGWNKLLGKTSIPLRNLLQGTSGTIELDQTLLGENDQPTTGKISMSLQYTPGQQNPNRKSNLDSALLASSRTAGDFADGIAGHDVEGTNNNNIGYKGGTPNIGRQTILRPRDVLSNIKTKFQIRVKIVEARQLMGEDLSPICRVTYGSKIHQTRIQKGTNSPWFNELYFFHEEDIFPKDFMTNIIDFTISNSRMMRSGCVIGNFKCEVGMIYDQPDHGIINRWLVLAHPDEPTPTIQGYLKVSIAVMGPGDNCPNMDVNKDEADDVEANLLWSAGVHLQPASFTLSIFCAQNLPRMDSGTMQTLKEAFGFGIASKELVDPYVIASYAGREIQTKVLYSNDNPEFRQIIHLGFLFPSMCNSLKLTLMDWDRVGDDDVIGTAIIPINSISASGEDGYLPSFGPAYVPIYGARREWELWEGQGKTLMNTGNEEGCSYRGRVLASLNTTVGAYPPLPTTDMDEGAFNKIRRFRSTRSFVLVAHVTHAYLLRESNRPLEIEVSMGNFGSKLESSLLPSPSSTHPSNPLFDGCKYYYLPWGESAPLIMVQCEWEDISHRLFASNAILYITQVLDNNLKSVKSYMKAKEPNMEDASVLLQKVLTHLKNLLSKQLPEADPVRQIETSLDIALKKRRKKVLANLSPKVESLMKMDSLLLIVEELQIILLKLQNLAIEPQNSIPDIFIWLMSGSERLAYTRISAQEVIFSYEDCAKGKSSGEFRSFNLNHPEDSTNTSIGGIVRASLWFGREEELISWWTNRNDLQLTVYAETYENQVITAPGSGKWTQKSSLLRRPPFSDADGYRALNKDAFHPSKGWKFQGDWTVDPDPSVKYSNDTGHTVFCEEVYQQQARVPGGKWIDAPTTWADVRGDPALPRDDLQCPNGWLWRDLWMTDLQRAVDSEGWEYTVQKGVTGWSPQEKLYHVLRRRRWVRERIRSGIVEKEKVLVEGWEYSSLFSSRFHARERAIDIVRRRRWRRKLVPIGDSSVPPTPRILVKDKEDSISQIISPRQYVMSAQVNKYQLRAHVYQARDLLPGDKSGFSDPYAVVSFIGSTQQTEKQIQTLCPTWDQTLIFDEIQISGTFSNDSKISQHPPSVVVEIYDWDSRGEPDFLGRTICAPVLSNCEGNHKPPKLQWHQVHKGNLLQGELLATFELLRKDVDEMPITPPLKGDLYMVPFGIRPLLQKTRVEILCWGVRNMATYELQSVTRPSIEFECGGKNVTSSVMNNYRLNPNFDDPHLTFDVELPKEDIYMPPMTIRVMDHRSFGSKPIVASAVINDLHKYNVEPSEERKRAVLSHTQSLNYKSDIKDKSVWKSLPCDALTPFQASLEPGLFDHEIDWWSKYYASTHELTKCGTYLKKGYEVLKYFGSSIEEDPKFNNFRDLVDNLPIYRGKNEDSTQVGEFKGTFRIYPISSDTELTPKILAGFPSPDPQEILVRVYIVSAKDLAPKDHGTTSDPYVVVSLKNQTVKGKEHCRAATLNPIFGNLYELKGVLPMAKDIVIQLWDKDLISSDDLIGETCIDLENRFLSRFRATVGLAKQYHVSGPNIWRDFQIPSEILDEVTKLRNTSDPVWNNDFSSVTIESNTYSIRDFEPKGVLLPPTLGPVKERLALHTLHEVFNLVPEHVESRTLYHPERPGLPQGTVQLMVDIFPLKVSIPPPINIKPRTPIKYILRMNIYNVYEVPLQERNLAGEEMSDVYVKGWIQGSKDVQKTDIHYRCMDGEANFNWRFVFHFDFLEAEQMMVMKKNTTLFSTEEAEELRPPRLTLQLWDNDLLSRDDYLSEMNLNLCHLMKPSKKKSGVMMDQLFDDNQKCHNENTTIIPLENDDDPVYLNLFEVKRIFGFIPFVKSTSGNNNPNVAGILEAELEVLTEEDSLKRPAGRGRDEPNANPVLPEPNRPATSFFWLSSPWKTFKHVFWKNYKWYIITFLVAIFLLFFILLFLYALPVATVDYMLGTY